MKGQPLRGPTGVETSVQIVTQVPVSMRERMRKATATYKELNWAQVVRDAIEVKLKSLTENKDASTGN
jgi:arsenate reductase-like glutaredoxin family protein